MEPHIREPYGPKWDHVPYPITIGYGYGYIQFMMTFRIQSDRGGIVGQTLLP